MRRPLLEHFVLQLFTIVITCAQVEEYQSGFSEGLFCVNRIVHFVVQVQCTD